MSEPGVVAIQQMQEFCLPTRHVTLDSISKSFVKGQSVAVMRMSELKRHQKNIQKAHGIVRPLANVARKSRVL